MNKQRNVFLFGAGAVIDWKAPNTLELTDLVRRSGCSTTDNETTITEFIYNQLKHENYRYINFETIINVIEELIVYYSSFDTKEKLSSIPHAFLTSKFENKIIPKNLSYKFPKEPDSNVTPEQYFLQTLLAKILDKIIWEIREYAYHTDVDTKLIIPQNEEMNQLFSKWISQINDDGILRMYSINYDKIFKIILEKFDENILVFEGFDNCDAKANVRKILSDTDCHVHYNLHGSIFWNVKDIDECDLPNPAFYLSATPNVHENDYKNTNWQSEKGKTIMLSNIITGYQKTQRGVFPPFKQMQAAFDKDCCFGDNIYIIGYSFNDEHINASIKIALEYNHNVKITIIDKNGIDLNTVMKIFPSFGNSREMKKTLIEDNVYSYYDGKFIVHEKTFKDYLKLIT